MTDFYIKKLGIFNLLSGACVALVLKGDYS